MLGERRIGALCALWIAVAAHGCAAEGPGNRSAGLTCMQGETQMCLCAGASQAADLPAQRRLLESARASAQGGGQGGAAASPAPGGASGQGPGAGTSAQASSGQRRPRRARGTAGMGQRARAARVAAAAQAARAGAMTAAGRRAARPRGGEFELGAPGLRRLHQHVPHDARPDAAACAARPRRRPARTWARSRTATAARRTARRATAKGSAAQNTCPGSSARGGTLEATLKGCLEQMWNEGEPAEGVQACIADRTGCFQMHGHWINMTMTSYGGWRAAFTRWRTVATG